MDLLAADSVFGDESLQLAIRSIRLDEDRANRFDFSIQKVQGSVWRQTKAIACNGASRDIAKLGYVLRRNEQFFSPTDECSDRARHRRVLLISTVSNSEQNPRIEKV